MTPGMCNLFNIPVTVHRIKNVSQWHLGASLWGEPLTVCLLVESYAVSLSELISARVTCAQAHLHYHKITSLAPDAYHVPQAFNEQELALFVICCPLLFTIFAISKSSRFEKAFETFSLTQRIVDTLKRPFYKLNFFFFPIDTHQCSFLVFVASILNLNRSESLPNLPSVFYKGITAQKTSWRVKQHHGELIQFTFPVRRRPTYSYILWMKYGMQTSE